MSATNTFETEILELIFNAANIDNIADNASSSPVTQYWLSLHTASPGETGTQSTSEATYTGYGRVALARSDADWLVDGSSVSNVSEILFPENTGVTPNTITYVGIGTSETSTGRLLFYGEIPSRTINENITPRFLEGDLVITVD